MFDLNATLIAQVLNTMVLIIAIVGIPFLIRRHILIRKEREQHLVRIESKLDQLLNKGIDDRKERS